MGLGIIRVSGSPRYGGHAANPISLRHGLRRRNHNGHHLSHDPSTIMGVLHERLRNIQNNGRFSPRPLFWNPLVDAQFFAAGTNPE